MGQIARWGRARASKVVKRKSGTCLSKDLSLIPGDLPRRLRAAKQKSAEAIVALRSEGPNIWIRANRRPSWSRG